MKGFVYSDIQWVVQRNLTNRIYLDAINEACMRNGVGIVEVDILPFSSDLPDFDRNKKSIFYGSTSFLKLVGEDPGLKDGLFFDAQSFSMENYIRRWGKHMLNAEATVTSFRDLLDMEYEPGKMLFIRPDDDSKSFAGEVIEFGEIRDWFGKLRAVENAGLSPDTRIVVSEPYNIASEWRLWVVKKKVVAASRYREYFRLSKSRGCPEEVVRYAEERCSEYTPEEVFVMDICRSGDSYYIVECNCMNGAGFYNADVDLIVSGVTAYVADMGGG